MKLDNSTSNICFDDVLLIPKKSNVNSRANINIGSQLGNPKNPAGWIYLDTPIMIAPMDFISTTSMIEKVLMRGGVAFIQRWQPIEKRLEQLQDLSNKQLQNKNLGFALSVADAVSVPAAFVLSCPVATTMRGVVPGSAGV